MGGSAETNEYREQEGNSGSAGSSNGDAVRELNRGTEVTARERERARNTRGGERQHKSGKTQTKKVPNVLNS